VTLTTFGIHRLSVLRRQVRSSATGPRRPDFAGGCEPHICAAADL